METSQLLVWIVLHQHEYGTSTYAVRNNVEPEQDDLVRLLAIDFEEDRDEFLEVYPLGTDLSAIPSMHELEAAFEEASKAGSAPLLE